MTRLVALAAGVVTVFTAVPAVGAAAEEVAIPRLTWSDCQDGFQCATAKVPLDYDRPAGTKIDLALIRLPAPDQARKNGTLFVNFGGSGGSGLQRLRERAKWPYLFSEELRTRFEIVEHVSTANTARDLDVLRRAVGDSKLTYHGISYGTHLGAVYANLFPDKIRAMVFDGSLDFRGNATGHGDAGSKVPLDTRQDVSRGIAETFEQFLALCAASGPRCG